jgi:hypothetical protein
MAYTELNYTSKEQEGDICGLFDGSTVFTRMQDEVFSLKFDV